MTVSIVICTRNRAENLKPTLESIGQVSIPPGWNVELLVVDNGSIDHTHSVVCDVRLSNVLLRYVNEPKPGLSRARNTGLGETRGEIILFTDDDVRVPLNWVSAMCQPILDQKADAVAGGVVFPTDIAARLSLPPYSSLRSWFASSEDLDPIRPSRMIGANMAFHRRVLPLVPHFDVELGAGALGSSEETLFSGQLLAAGCRLVGALDVTVEHHFDLSRLNPNKLIESAHCMGRSHAYVFYHWEHQRSRLAFPRLILSQMKRLWVRYSAIWKGTTVSLHSLKVEQEYAFYREYLVQRRRRCKYALRGLTPLATNTKA